MPTVLIANRGEVAVRIIDAVHAVGSTAVAVCAEDDDLHTRRADAVVRLEGTGPAPYLDIAQIIAAAERTGARLVHPGYGFLSESAAFARACAEAGLTFAGPSPEALETFGDKAAARDLAQRLGVPVVPATGLAPSAEEAEAFLRAHGAVMVKATSGGGGRGLRKVTEAEHLAAAIADCAREAEQFFGTADVFLERLVESPRHIEVQVVGDGSRTQHLWERDCSVQRRNQKLIEVAPSPDLPEEMRRRILAAALRIADGVGLKSLATVEFLVEDGRFHFMEVNPRLQVEHTVTEEITGVDLVAAQLRIAAGATLAEAGLAEPPAASGFALQARVNAEHLDGAGYPVPSTGRIEHLSLPSGRYVRVDTALRKGAVISPRFDSLVAKVITRAETFEGAAAAAARALEELRIDPLMSSRALLHGVLTDEEFLSGRVGTGYLDAGLSRLLAHELPCDGVPSPSSAALPESTAAEEGGTRAVPDGAVVIRAQLAGVVVSLGLEAGEELPAGADAAVVEAMKMEHPVRTPVGLVVDEVCVRAGDLVQVGQVLAFGRPGAGAGTAEDLAVSAPGASRSEGADAAEGGPGQEDAEPWAEELEEIRWRHAEAAKLGGEAKIAKQRADGKMTAPERIAALADAGSYEEIGPLAGAGRYADDGSLVGFRPSNHLTGTARLDGRRALLGVDDFTIRGGSGDAAVHEKQIFAEKLAGEMRVPLVRVLDGASGGGSVKKVLEAGAMYLPVNPGWDSVVENLSRVPVVSVCAGPTVGLGAARFVMSHFGVMVSGVGQLFTAGPPVVRAATGEDLDKEGLGGEAVHRGNGTVERFVPDEETAYAVVRSFLSYLPSSVDELPPVIENADPGPHAEEVLARAIPRNPRRIYAIDPILEAVFDRGSVFRFAEYGDGTYTALARLAGRPVGVITADPRSGATLSREGAQAVERLVDLCETFHLPIVSLTDQAGMTIGLQAEGAATIRAGARALTAVYQARVPQAEIILRRVYGVGGAGIVNRHRAVRSWAWPSGDWGSLPPQGGIEAAFRAELERSTDREAMLAALTAELERVSSRFRTAETFSVQDIIDPRTTRRRLCEWAEDAYRVLPRLLGAPSFGVRP
ncbi:acetyl-CoA carboxylase family protein [Brevibacterium album]|uniref:acetyl-CoA carboxylase family protein n=1 Tax=Brevibacterium album TaxID=417948 RepID=UPI0004003CCB|nr:carboxyl transferase domain-containing protein [Brevibacterium album]